MPDALDEQIEAFEALLPDIKRRYGSAWVLVADRKLISTFPAFAAAARYASEHFGRRPVLIRHTDEKPVESAPFVHVRASH
ncbi:MAG TPA: hypothetical protein VGF50_02645 [Caulobacteraceae bacterium]|jgi:hypothetical protein